MIALRFVCALAVVGACWGEAALHPTLNRNLHPTLRYDVFTGDHGDRFDDDDQYDNDLSSTLYRYRTAPFEFNRVAPAYHPQQAPAVPTYNAPGVSTYRAPAVPAFNAPAVNSLRGKAVIPTPSVVPLNAPHVPFNAPHVPLNAPHVPLDAPHVPLNVPHVPLDAPHVPPHHGKSVGPPVTLNKPSVPYANPKPSPKPVQPIKSQFHVQDELGQYSFGYDAGTSTREESRDAYGNVRGSFSYIDPNGKLQVQHYVAGKDGFRVRGTNLPVQVTSEGRYKRSYATFPAGTGPLQEPFYGASAYTSHNTPYFGPYGPRKTVSYSLQSFPDGTSHSFQSFPDTSSHSFQSFPDTTSYNFQSFPDTTSYNFQSFPSVTTSYRTQSVPAVTSYTSQPYPSLPLRPHRGYYY